MTDLHDTMARAMRAQGKVDPDEVFAEAEQLDLGVPAEPEHDPEQEALPIEGEERGYAWEP